MQGYVDVYVCIMWCDQNKPEKKKKDKLFFKNINSEIKPLVVTKFLLYCIILAIWIWANN